MKTNKKILSILIVLMLLLQGGSLIAYGIENLAPYPVYEGINNASSLLDTISFQDMSGHWAGPAIQQASALGLMKGTGNKRFSPNQALTHAQALTILVNGIGLEAEAQRLGANQSVPRVRDLIILSAADDWAKGYIQVATQNNIVTPAEVNKILDLTQARADALEDQVQNIMDRYLGMDLDNNEIANIEAQVRDLNQARVTWNRPANREQVAIWVARALDLEPVQDIVKIYQFTDWKEIETGNIPYIEAILQKNIMTGVGNNTFSAKGQLTRAQMSQIVANIKDDLFEKRGLLKLVGDIVNIEQVEQQGKPKGIITVFNHDGTQNYIEVEPPTKDVIVQKDGRLGLTSLLKEGDQIKYYINESNKAFFIQVDKEQEKIIEGFLDYISYENRQMIVTDFSNKRHILEAEVNTAIYINDKKSTFNDLLFGQEVKVTVRGNHIRRIDGYLEEDPDRHGYISPGSRTKIGNVLFLSNDGIEIQGNEGREKFRITDQTQVLRSSGKAQLFEIKSGDRVVLSFNDIYSPDIATIRVEDSERHIESIYRGILDGVNVRRNEVILRDVSFYENGNWTKHPSQKLTLRAEDNTLFDGNRNVALRDLERSTGKEVYVAVENSYGVHRVAKLLLKQGSTVIHESKVSSVQFGTNEMIVDNNRISFHPGTIVVKNNRLVDILNLDFNQSVYVVADVLMGLRSSAFIAIEYEGLLEPRPGATQLKIYRGKIEDIYDYSITIGRLSYSLNYLQLANNQWAQVPYRQKVTLTEDTYIYDSELEAEIPTKAFLDSRFIDPHRVWNAELRQRVEQGFYKDKTAYFVVRETINQGAIYSEVLAVNITPTMSLDLSNVRLDHSAMGNVESVDLNQERITLKDVKHWNSLNNRWEPVRTTEIVDLKSATVLINDRPIDRNHFYQIKAGAKTYMVKVKNNSTGDDAYVLIIEQ